MSKFDEKDIEKLLGHMPEIKDEQSSDYYYKNIDEELLYKQTKRRSKKKTKLYPVLASVAALFLVMQLSAKYLPIGAPTFDEGSDAELSEFNSNTDMKQYANDEQAESSVEPQGGESMESAEINQEDSTEESKDASFTRVVHANDETNENLVTYFFPDEQLQLLIPVTFEHQGSDPYEAFNYAQKVIPDDFPINDNLYEYLSFKEIDSSGMPVIQIDVDRFQKEYPGGSTIEILLLQTINAYFAELNEDTIKLVNTNGENVSLSHSGEIDQPLEVESTEKQPFKIIYLTEIDEPYYVQSPDFSGESTESISIEDAFQRMKREDEYTEATSSIPSDWEIHVDNQTEGRLYLTIENVAEETEQSRIIAIETMLLTAKSFGFNEVVFSMDGIEHIGGYPIGEPIQVPAYVNPHH
ncbi:hypothetical protein ACFFJI_07685 [Allobacillus sp. GCM10007491]|uniref:GerMN domain-containing protein n=1 Tax=Allobacillus saliphilus TaxID=2912308 RepID=A0A941HSC8_9BACI|nr:hypothetical protein [Allobacillus saliphilus]MBR7553283.1 hypothetical protein [Allobacillus saliphilus]